MVLTAEEMALMKCETSSILDTVDEPAALRELPESLLHPLVEELREELVYTVAET